jgi:hypothetical protein
MLRAASEQRSEGLTSLLPARAEATACRALTTNQNEGIGDGRMPAGMTMR